MAKLVRKIINAKLLLFGEHLINKGADGLAIPIEKYHGWLTMGDLSQKHIAASNRSLQLLAEHIVHSDALAPQYDTNQMLEHVERGLYFDSNIPQGYGLGSSGALVAAVFGQYYRFRRKGMSAEIIKNHLAQLEGFYHGKSSGLDALVCYLNVPVLINEAGVNEKFSFYVNKKPAVKFFLINTHQSRQTGAFVHLFLKKCEDPKFLHAVEKSFIPVNNMAIAALQHGSSSDLWKSVLILSQLQLDLMAEFIPKAFQEVWREGLRNNQFHLKICGAGGGGFIIGMARADADLSLLLRGLDVTEVFQW